MNKLMYATVFILTSAFATTALANDIVGLAITAQSEPGSFIQYLINGNNRGAIHTGDTTGVPTFGKPYDSYQILNVKIGGKDITQLCNINVTMPYAYLTFDIKKQSDKVNCAVTYENMPTRTKH